MNIKRILSVIAVIGIMALAACGDDDKPLRERFSFDDKTLSVKDARVYLVYDGTFGDRMMRYYLATDGEYDTEEGEFMNATYFVEIDLLTAEDADDFTKGDYEAWDDWNDAAAATKIGYVDAYAAMDDDNYFNLYTADDAAGEDEIKVSGGFDDGETITFKYSGDLDHYYQNDNDEWVTETVSGNFTIKGEIEEISMPLARLKKGKKVLN